MRDVDLVLAEESENSSSISPLIPLRGELAGLSLAAAMHRLHAEAKTGILRLTRGETSRDIHIVDGNPVSVESSRRDESLGAYLMNQGKISMDVHETSLQRVEETGRDQGEVLIELGAIGANELFEALREHLRLKVLSCLAWNEGEYAFVETGGFPTDVPVIKLDTPRLVIDACARYLGPGQFEERVGRADAVSTAPEKNPFYTAQQLGLSPAEQRIYNAAISGAAVDEICRRAGSREKALPFVYALKCLGVIRFNRVVSASPAEPAPSSRPAPSSSARPPSSPRSRPSSKPTPVTSTPAPSKRPSGPARKKRSSHPSGPAAAPSSGTRSTETLLRRRQFLQQYLRLKESNHFALLGVSRDATDDEIGQAYDRLVMRFHPDTVMGTEPGQRLAFSDISGKVEALFKQIQEAYRTLGDRARRNEYLDGLGDPPKIESRNPPKSKVASKAEQAYRLGRRYIEGGEHDLATKALRVAVREDPDEPLYYAYLGWAQFLADRENASDAQDSIRMALLFRPDLDCAHYFRGMILKYRGDASEAAVAFRTALKYNEDYPEAARELRALESGKGRPGEKSSGVFGKLLGRKRGG